MNALTADNERVLAAAVRELRRRLELAQTEQGWSRLTLSLETERGKAKDRFHVAKNDDLRVGDSCIPAKGG